MQEQVRTNESEATELRLDEARLRRYMEELRENQNLVYGFLGGLAAAALGAALWAVITVFTEYQIGWMAVGVGALVGYAVRRFGRGVDVQFGVLGAVLALAGCVAGNLLSVVGFVAREEGLPFFQMLLALNPEVAVELLRATFDGVDLLFYGLAIYAGYRFSIRTLSEEELAPFVIPS